MNGLADDEVTVHLLGGDLRIHWDKELNKVFMTGAAATVFDGEIDVSECGTDRPPHMVDPAW